MKATPDATQSFAVLVVEDGRARISRFHIDVCGETLWEVGPEGLAQRLELVRPSLIAVVGEREGARDVANALRRRGVAESVFLVTTTAPPPSEPGQVPVALPPEVTADSPQELLQALVEALVSAFAQFPVSPLTGLPCSPALKQNVEDRLARGEAFAFLHLDLDNFKAYNDLYGFGRGDIAIRALGREVEAALRGVTGSFAAHIGGDDFAVVTAPGRAAQVARQIIREFGRKAPRLYPKEAQEAGYVETHNRQGKPTRYPLMTVSVGGVSSSQRLITSYLQLTELAAEMKAYAKSAAGGRFVMDRRTG